MKSEWIKMNRMLKIAGELPTTDLRYIIDKLVEICNERAYSDGPDEGEIEILDKKSA